MNPSVALARAHLGYDMAVRWLEAARVMAERPSSNLAAGCICQLHFVKRSACRACAQICFHLIQAEVHKPESQSVAVCTGKACRSGERRCCAKHQPCSYLRYARSVADWALVAMLMVTSSSKWRAAPDVDVGAAQLHDASTHRLCELLDDEIQRKHRITVKQQHSLTSSHPPPHSCSRVC